MRWPNILWVSKTDNGVWARIPKSVIGRWRLQIASRTPVLCSARSRSRRGCGLATRSRAFGTLVDAPRPHSRARIRRSGGTAECMDL